MPDSPIVQMAADPDFGKLPLQEQRKALAAHDPSFGKLGDADVTKFVRAHQSFRGEAQQKAAGLPQPQQPIPSGLQPSPPTERVTLASGSYGVPITMDVPKGYGPAVRQAQQDALSTGTQLGAAVAGPAEGIASGGLRAL